MNILHIESGPNWGGQEYRNVLEIQWLNAHGHRAWLMCDPDSQSFRHAEASGLPAVALRMDRRLYLANLFKIWRMCCREKVDVIQTHSSRDSWLCFPLYRLGFPVVRSRNITHRVTRASRAFVYRHGCSHIIATADCIKKDLVEFSRVNPDRIEVFGEGVDLGVFNPQVSGREFRAELDIPQEVPLVGMVAMLRSEKGALDFVEAAAEVMQRWPAARFVLVGDGPQRPLVENKVQAVLERFDSRQRDARLQSKCAPITLAGYRQDTPNILAALDVVVVPSRHEARCRVLAEALATGCAVVATCVGGIPEIIRDGVNGLLVPPKQPEALAQAICRLLSDSALRKRLVAAAWETAQRELSFDAVMQNTVALYQRLCAKPRRGIAV